MKQARSYRPNLRNPSHLETLESRRLMSATTIGIYGSINGSETNPTTTGRGEFIFKRPTGSTLHSMTLAYYLRSTSTTSTSDYQTLTGTVTIPRDKRSVAVNVFPIDDTSVEGTETLALVLRNRSDATNVHNSGSITIADNDTMTSSWLGGDRTSRSSFTYNPDSTSRTDLPFDYSINFTSILSGLNKSGSLVDNSIKVVEVSSTGAQVNAAVPFQFDHAESGYNAATNASGDLVVEATGTTAANATRYYQVYFDTTGTYAAPSFTSLVTTTDNVNDSNSTNSIKLQTQTATYYYQKPYGAFSQIVDTEGNDWVSWNSTPGSAGEYRGTPNLGAVGFHPGRLPTYVDSNGNTQNGAMTTSIVSSGPLKTVIESTASVTGNKVRWEIYPTFARLTVLHVDSRNYWFLYEATPGGSGPSSNDRVVESDGSVDDATFGDHNNSNTDFNHSGEEWAYIENTTVNNGNGRYIFLVHNNPDTVTDSYYDLDGNMTVFGFGRNNTSDGDSHQELSGVNTFTIGLADGGGTFSTAAATIKAAYKASTLAAGAAAVKPS